MENKPTTVKHRRVNMVWYIVGTVGVIMLAGLFLFVWVYFGDISPAKARVLKALRLPIGKIGDDYVSFSQLAGNSNSISLSDSNFTNYAESLKRSYLLQRLGYKPTADSEDILSDTDRLKIAWAGNEKLNPRFATMKSYEAKLVQGITFKELAGTYSEDPATAQFGGDAGYVELGQSLPEFKRALSSLHAGDYTIIPTRYGLELVLVEDIIEDSEGRTLTKIRHLTLENKGFDDWLTKELARIPVTFYIGN